MRKAQKPFPVIQVQAASKARRQNSTSQSKLTAAIGSAFERLEVRRLMSTVYVDGFWKITHDVAPIGGAPSTGDTVQNSIQGGDSSITATYGANAFDSVPHALASGHVASGDTIVVVNENAGYGASTDTADITIPNVIVEGWQAYKPGDTFTTGPTAGQLRQTVLDTASYTIDAAGVTVEGFSVVDEAAGGITITSNGTGYLITKNVFGSATSPNQVSIAAVGGSGTISNNTFNSDGISIDVTAGTHTISGNTITNTLSGDEGIVATGGTTTINGGSISGETTGIEIGSGAIASINGITLSNTTDLLVDSGALSLTVGNTAATIFQGTSYINNESTLTINATTDTFNVGASSAQVAGSALTNAQAFAVEDKITDAVDESGLGFVRTVPNAVFVTPASFVAPATTDAGAVQRGVDAASSGDTVYLEAGTYIGANTVDSMDGFVSAVNIDKPLTLQGPNASYSANTSVTPANAQAIILPGSSDPTFDSNESVGVEVTSSNVTIQGLTLIGTNSALTHSGGVTFHGVPLDAAEGVVSYRGVGSVNVLGNIIENFSGNGVDLYNGDNSAATSDNTISRNLIQHISDVYNGVGVLVYNNFYAQITNNLISDVRAGVQTGNFFSANSDGAFAPQISNNVIATYHDGIYYNLHYSNASAFTISGNNITALAPASDDAAPPITWNGIVLSSQQNAVSATLTNNSINGTGTTVTGTTSGYEIWNAPTTGALAISGGSVTGVQYGVWANSYEGGKGNGLAVTASVSSVAITASAAGIYVEDSAANSTHPSVSLSVSGSTISGANVGILVSGAAASATISSDNLTANTTGISDTAGIITVGSGNSITGGATGLYMSGSTAVVVGNTLGNLTFSGQSGNYVTLASAAAAGKTINAQGVSFDGVIGSAATSSQALAIENKITDALDNSTLGLVRIQGTVDYVTHQEEVNSPGAIERAVLAAAPGDTIIVEGGTYVDNININKSLTLVGANTGTAGSGTRAAETIITPAGNQNAVITVTKTSGVTIDGFTIDGFTASATGAALYSGDTTNVAYDVVTSGAVSGLTLENNIIKRAFIGFRGDGLSTGNSINNNAFDSIGNFDFGYAVTLRTDFYANITNNVMTRVWSGVHLNNFHNAGGPAVFNITGNQIHDYAGGVLDWLQYGSATPLTLNNNQISVSTDETKVANNVGIEIVTLQNADSISITNDTVTGTDYGVIVYNASTTNPVTLGSTDSITDSKVAGVLVTDNLNFNAVGTTNFLASGAGAASTANLTGVAISGATGNGVIVDASGGTAMSATITGTSVSGTSGSTGVTLNGSLATANISSSTVSGFATGINVAGGTLTTSSDHVFNTTTGILIDNGGSASVTGDDFTGSTANTTDLLIDATTAITGGTLTGDNFGGSSFFIKNGSAQNLDATGATFNGTSPTSQTLAQLYGDEDKIVDYLDNASLGYVKLSNTSVYVAASSEAASADAIQRGVNVAPSAGTVNVQAGTFAGPVTVSTALTLQGAGSTTFGTVVTDNSANGLTIQANDVTAEDLLISGNGANDAVFFDSAVRNASLVDIVATGQQYGIEVHNNAALTNLSLDRVSLFNSTDGMRVSTTGTVSGLTVTNSHFDNDGSGLYTAVNTSNANNGAGFTGINISGSTFSNDIAKGIYTEKLSNATFNGITVNNSGTGASSPNGVNLNLKYGIYTNITIENSTFDNDGTGAAGFAAVDIEGRNDASYVAHQGNLTNLTLSNLNFNGTVSGATSPLDLALGGSITGIVLNSLQFHGTGVGMNYFGSTGLNLSNASFASTLSTYLVDSSTNGIDATAATFGAVGPTDNTPGDLYGVEDKITDYLDRASLGYVNLRSGTVYDAASSDVASVDSIQRAVNVASAGGTVDVQAGTFSGDVEITKSLTLLGAQNGVDPGASGWTGPQTTTTGSGANAPISIDAGINNVKIDGFVIQSPAAGSGNSNGGIFVNSSSAITIQNNILQDNTTGVAVGDASVTVQNNLIQDNNAPGNGGGNGVEFFAGTSQASTVANNHFSGNESADVLVAAGASVSNINISNNTLTASGGIDLFDASNITVAGNTAGAMEGPLVYVGGGDSAVSITGNTVTSVTSGNSAIEIANPYVYLGYTPNSSITISGNSLTVGGTGGAAIELNDDTTSGSAYSGALTLSGDSMTTSGSDIAILNKSTTPVDATAEKFNGLLASSGTLAQEYTIVDTIVDGVDVAGYGLVRTKAGNVYVTPHSFAAPAANDADAIKRAVVVASDGDTVHVESGTYHERQVVINKGLNLQGDSAATTIIDGGGESNTITNSSGTLNIQNTTASQSVTIQGVTVQNAALPSDENLNDGTSDIEAIHVAGPVTIANDILIGEKDANELDCALQVVVAGQLTVTNTDISGASQGMLIEDATGAVNVSGNTVHSMELADGYYPEGIFLLNDSGTSDSGPIQIDNNTFSDYRGSGISIEGGYSYAGSGTSSNIQIEGNTINVVGEGAAGIGIYNGAGNPTDAASSGITAAIVSGNTITGDGSAGADGIDVDGLNTGISISGNTISGTDIGIATLGDATVGSPTVDITANTVSGSTTADIVLAGTATVYRNKLTTSPIGLEVTSGADLTSATQNYFTGNGIGVEITATAGTVGGINTNSITGNTIAGLENDSSTIVNASQNWWNSPKGPTTPLNTFATTGTGDKVIGTAVIISPWLADGVDAAAGTPGFQHVDASNTAPIVGTPVLTSASDTGFSNSDRITKTNTPTLTGSFTVSVGTATPTIAIYDGTTFLGNATVSGSGSSWTWTFSTPSLTDGTHSITATATDTAGNSATSAALSLTIETQPPVVSTPVLTTDSGLSGTDRATNVNTPSFSGTFSVEDGSTKPTIAIYDGSTLLGSAVVTGSGTNWTWTYTSTTLADGSHSITALATDVAGNTTASTALVIVVDTHAPTVSTPILSPDTGLSTSDNTTNSNKPTFSGTVVVEDGSIAPTVSIYDHGTIVGSATVTAGSDSLHWNYTYTATGTFSDGSHSITALATDVAGNTSTSTALVIVIDTTAPTVSTPVLSPDTGSSTSDNTTNSNKPTFSGTVVVEDGSIAPTVSIYDHGTTLLGTATITAGSDSLHWNYTFTPTVALSDGSHLITALATDVAGNTTTSTALAIVIDTTAPTVSTPVLSPDTGLSTSDNTTNSNKPTFSGTVVVEDGSIAPTVSIKDGGVVLGTATITAGSDSLHWNYRFTVSTALSDGSHSITAFATDVAGNATTSSALSIVVDTAAPTVSTPLLAPDTGLSSSDHTTSSNTPTFSGTVVVENGSIAPTVSIKDGGVVIGTATITAGSDSLHWNYSFTVSTALSDGGHSITAFATDVAGNTTTSTVLSIVVDTVAPTVSKPALTPDSGLSSSDGTTSSNTPTFSGTVVVEDGSIAPTVSIKDGGVVLGTATITAGSDSLHWNYSFTPTIALSDGSHSITAFATDVAGNTSTSTALAIIVDTTAPTVSTPVLSPDTGLSATDKTTNSNKPTFSGTVVVEDGSIAPTVSIYDHGTTLLGTATITAGSDSLHWNYSFTVSTSLADGAHSITAFATDVAGNTTTSSALAIVVDTTAPTVSTPVLSPDTGLSASDKTTNSNKPTFSGTVLVEDGSIAPTVSIYDHGTTLLGTATITAGSDSLHWNYSFTPTIALSDGSHSITAFATDVAGNTSTSTALAIIVDTTAPTVSTPVLSPDTGLSATDKTTNSNKPTFSGTVVVEDGSIAPTVSIYDHGTTLLGTATITAGSDSLHWNYTFTATVALIDGSHSITAFATDVAGNTTISTALAIVVDTQSPVVATPVLTTDTGFSNTDGITKTATPSFTGTFTVEDGSIAPIASVYDGGVLLGSATVTGSGTSWSWTYNSGTLTDGAHSITVRATDVAGNTTSSSPLAITIDTVNPAPTINGSSVKSESGFEGTLVSLAGLPNDATPSSGVQTYNWHVTDNNGQVIADGSSQSFSFTPNDNGTYNVTYTVTDKAGNVGTAADVITVANVAPVASLVTNASPNVEGSTNDLTVSATDVGSVDQAAGFTFSWTITRQIGGAAATTFASHTTSSGLQNADISFTPDLAGTYTVFATATDKDGTVSTVVSTTFTVASTPPTVDLSASATSTNEGSTYTLKVGAVTDPGPNNVVGYFINWGDGTSNTGSPTAGNPANSNFTHTYKDGPANWVIQVTIIDSEKTSPNVASLNIQVNNVPPTATVQNFFPTVSIGSSGEVGLSNPQDASSTDQAAPFTYAFNFSDNAGDTAGTYVSSGSTTAVTVPASSLFAPGVYYIGERVIDKDGGFTDYVTTITVTDSPPIVSLGSAATVGQSQLFTRGGSFSYPGNNGPYTAMVDYNFGGTGDTGFTPLTLTGNNFTLSNTYATTGTYNIKVTVTDGTGTTGSSTLQVTVNPTGFQVTSFTQTPSGFDVTFNHTLSTANLNLYHGLSNTYGAPDVTLVGPGGKVTGSLIYDDSTNTLHFIKTGGVLAPGSYTAMLVSGAQAFHDTSGNVLSAGNYTQTFSVSPDVAVLIPDVMRGPGQAVNSPAISTSGLPITISDGTGVTAVDFELLYNANDLNISAVNLASSLPSGWSVVTNGSTAGDLRVSVFGTTTLSSGLQTLLNLVASVPGSAVYGASADLQIVNLRINEGAIGGAGDDSVEKVAFLGDASGNKGYSSFDASLIANVVVGNASGFDAFPMIDPVIIGDVTADGTLSGQDASDVAQQSVGITVNLLPPIPAGTTTTSPATGLDPTVTIGSIALANPGTTIIVPVSISDDGGLLGANFAIGFNASQLQFVSATTGTVDGGFTVYTNPDNTAGTLQLGLQDNSTALTGGAGTIAYLTFTVRSTAPSGSNAVTLAGADGGLNEGGLALSTVNGTVNVQPASFGSASVFYNGSTKFDSKPDVTAANIKDFSAIATDKSALMPGGTATFANYTSYSLGLNGIVVDFVNMGPGATFNVGDFTFHVGNTNTPSGWALAPVPISVTAIIGPNGDTYADLIWANNAIQDQWLQVTVLANADTHLSAPVTFYYGNVIGSTGDSSTSTKVTSADVGLTQNNETSLFGTATINNVYDFNRDGKVTSLDVSIAQNNETALFKTVNLISVPTGPAASPTAQIAAIVANPVASTPGAPGPVANSVTAPVVSKVDSFTNPLTPRTTVKVKTRVVANSVALTPSVTTSAVVNHVKVPVVSETKMTQTAAATPAFKLAGPALQKNVVQPNKKAKPLASVAPSPFSNSVIKKLF